MHILDKICEEYDINIFIIIHVKHYKSPTIVINDELLEQVIHFNFPQYLYSMNYTQIHSIKLNNLEKTSGEI